MEMQSVQKVDACVALAGIKASRVWTLELILTVRGCPDKWGNASNGLVDNAYQGIFTKHKHQLVLSKFFVKWF